MKKTIKMSDRINKNFEKFNSSHITAGIHKKEGRVNVRRPYGRKTGSKRKPYSRTPKGVNWTRFTVYNLAVQNEFGHVVTLKKNSIVKTKDGRYFTLKRGKTYKVPARPFIRSVYIDPKRKEAVALAFRMTYKALLGKRAAINKIWSEIGEVAKQQIQSEILNRNTYPPNAPLTSATKGFDQPLFETGRHLLKSIKFKIVKGGR